MDISLRIPGSDGLLLLGGDTGEAGRRLSDVWRLDAASDIGAAGAAPMWLQLHPADGAAAMQSR